MVAALWCACTVPAKTATVFCDWGIGRLGKIEMGDTGEGGIVPFVKCWGQREAWEGRGKLKTDCTVATVPGTNDNSQCICGFIEEDESRRFQPSLAVIFFLFLCTKRWFSGFWLLALSRALVVPWRRNSVIRFWLYQFFDCYRLY